jgi:hypothetical protein
MILADAIKMGAQLVSLNLTSNKLSDKAAFTIASFLLENRTITTLTLASSLLCLCTPPAPETN